MAANAAHPRPLPPLQMRANEVLPPDAPATGVLPAHVRRANCALGDGKPPPAGRAGGSTPCAACRSSSLSPMARTGEPAAGGGGSGGGSRSRCTMTERLLRVSVAAVCTSTGDAAEGVASAVAANTERPPRAGQASSLRQLLRQPAHFRRRRSRRGSHVV